MGLKAPIERRMSAFAIDIVLSSVVASVFLGAGYVFWNYLGPDELMSVAAVVSVLLGVIISVGFFLVRDALFSGYGVGKRKMMVRVVRMDGSRCDVVSSIVRNFTMFVPVLNLAEMILAVADREGRRLGDRLAETQVIE